MLSTKSMACNSSFSPMYESYRNPYYLVMKTSKPSNLNNKLKDKIINNEINALELSNDELDTVAGSLAISFGDVGGFASDASNT